MIEYNPQGGAASGAAAGFGFKLTDLLYWVVKRKDGTLIKYQITDSQPSAPAGTTQSALVKYGTGGGTYSSTTHYSLSAYCNHTPDLTKPLYVTEDSKLALYIADSEGIRKTKSSYDFIIDAGNVFNATPPKLLRGDPTLCQALEQHTYGLTGPRLLQIDWFDRKAPEVYPEFWPELLKLLDGNVGINCQGGHGRSGTAIVALMMCLTDYSAKEGIIHLRALHCPRAIESKEQHAYLNDVSEMLGRARDAEEAEEITDYREAFRKLADAGNKTALRFVKRLEEAAKK